MLDQLSALVKQYGDDAVVNNNAVPNQYNQEVLDEASSSIFTGLQQVLSQGGTQQLAEIFQGDNAASSNNAVVQQLSQQLSGNLGAKFGLDSATASGLAGSLVPKVLGALIGKAKNPNDSSLQISDIVNAIGGSNNSGLMDAISQYGGQFGLDQNNDGKVDMGDAMAAVNKKGGLGGLLGKFFGK